MTGKRLLLLAVAGLLSAAAALAIGILLFGDFGETEGRILATTALLAGYALLALPAAILLDRGRLRGLAAVVGALAAVAAALTVGAIWSEDPPETFAKAMGTVNGWLVASVQVAALSLRRRTPDPLSVRRLFAVSSLLAAVLAAMLTVLLWAEIDSEGFGRIFGALLVLDALLVALQPILARARPATTVHRLRVRVAPAETIELSVEAPDLAAAASKAIRSVAADGRRVLAVELIEAGQAPAASAVTEAMPVASSRSHESPRSSLT